MSPETEKSAGAGAPAGMARHKLTKVGKARLTAPRDKDRGDGGALPAPLTYRWRNAFQIATDIRDGLGI